MTRTNVDADLSLAVLRGDEAAFTVAIQAGANVNSLDSSGRVPLHWAASHKSEQIVAALIANGADVNVVDNSGDTPLQIAARCGYSNIVALLQNANSKQQGHAGRIDDERKDKGPRQVGG